MTVHAGNMNDPPALPGCAHFTEHMLFLGTEKYPVEGEYKRYLLEHGGAGNASTGLEHTKYHFRVQAAFLEGALDRFAQFFIAPTFTESATEREISAVESEYAKNLQLDSRQKFQLMRHLSDQEHPYNRFGSGNRATLSEAPSAIGTDARALMIEWYKQHYCTDIMTLCVCGDKSISELEAMVRSMFALVPQRGAEQAASGPGAPALPGALAAHGLPFKLAQCGVVASIDPVKQLRSVQVSWHLPHRAPGDTRRPYRLLSHLLGHEGSGSVLAELKRQNLATGLSASTVSNSFQSNASVTVVLTPQGERQWAHVLRVLYAYIAMLRRHAEAGDMPEHVWGDMSLRNSTQFRFKTPSNAQDTARAVALNLQYFPPAFAEYAPYAVAEVLPADAWREALECLTPQNAITVRVGKLWGDLCTSTEKWFGARYHVQPVSEEHMQMWGALPEQGTPAPEAETLAWQVHPGLPGLQFPALTPEGESTAAAATDSPSASSDVIGLGDGVHSPARYWVWPCSPGWAAELAPALHLPGKNTFMANKFAMVFPEAVPGVEPAASLCGAAFTREPLSAAQCLDALQVKPSVWPTAQAPYPMTTPLLGEVRLPLSGHCVRLWCRPDGPWRLPKALVNIVFRLPAASGVCSAKQAVLGLLYTNIVDDVLSHVTYDASLAGMQYSTSRGSSTFLLQVSGYSQRLHVLASTVLQELVPEHEGRWTADEAVFRRQAEVLARRLASKAAAQPRVHASQAAAALLQPSHHTPEQLLQALVQCTPDDLSSEVHRIWHRGEGVLVDVAAAGNIAPAALGALAEGMLASFDAVCAPAPLPLPAAAPVDLCEWELQTRVLALPPGVFRHTARHPNTADTNSAVVFNFQLGAAADDETAVLASLVAALMRQPCFDTLRTKEQLGYIVSSGCVVEGGVRSLRIIVQSATATVAFVEWRVHVFLRVFRDELREMLQDDSQKLREMGAVLRSEWLSPPKTWNSWASAAMRPVVLGSFDFKQPLRLAQLSHMVTAPAVLAFYDACFLAGGSKGGVAGEGTIPDGTLLHYAQAAAASKEGAWEASAADGRGRGGALTADVTPPFSYWTTPQPTSGAGGGQGDVDVAAARTGRCLQRRLLVCAVHSCHPRAPQPAVALFNQLDRRAVAAVGGTHAYKHTLLDVPQSGAEYGDMCETQELSSVPPTAVHAGVLAWWGGALGTAGGGDISPRMLATFPSRQEQALPCPAAEGSLPSVGDAEQ